MIASTGFPNLFVTASLAGRIERAETSMIEDGAAGARGRVAPGSIFLEKVAGGIAAFVDNGSPFNKVAGLGFAGLPDDAILSAIERAFAARGGAVQVELSSLGDPEIGRTLTRRGYELVGFENVLGLALDSDAGPGGAIEGPDSTLRVTRVVADDNKAWVDTVAAGFLHPDIFDGPASHDSFDRDALERVYLDTIAAPSFERFLAWRGAQVAGGASLRVHDRIAQLCGASTLPDHRRHGVQSALLRYRLALAASRGCDLAVVTTQPGSKSQQNVQRFGFTLLYTRAMLVKPAPAAP